jgi:ketol-acid reductoisomerase
MHANVKSMYETMTHEGYEDSLKEIEKMHMEMKRLYAEMAKVGK